MRKQFYDQTQDAQGEMALVIDTLQALSRSLNRMGRITEAADLSDMAVRFRLNQDIEKMAYEKTLDFPIFVDFRRGE
jgi:hypothetical protein